MGQRTDISKQFKVKVMGASEVFDFNGKDWEQAVIVNLGSPDVYLRDSDDNDFIVAEGQAFNASQIPAKTLDGMRVVTQSGGSCQIGYFQ